MASFTQHYYCSCNFLCDSVINICVNFHRYLLGYWDFLSFSFSANEQNVLKIFFPEVALISWDICVLVGLSLFLRDYCQILKR